MQGKNTSWGGGTLRISVFALALLTLFSFFYATPQAEAVSATDAIVVNADGTEATIQGDTSTTEIRSTLLPYQSTLKTVIFKNELNIVATKESEGAFEDFRALESVQSADGKMVHFVGPDDSTPANLFQLFYAPTSLSNIDGLAFWDVSKVTGAYSMFHILDGASIANVDALSSWDVSNLTGDYCLSSAFDACTFLTNLDGLRTWDTSNVKGSGCFANCFSCDYKLTNIDALSSWNVRNVTGYGCFSGMFYECDSLTNLDALSMWEVTNTTGEMCMSSMFAECDSLLNINGLQNWDITKAIASKDGTEEMFKNTPIESMTLSSTFYIASNMSLTSTNWWKVDPSTTSAKTTSQLVALSPAEQTGRWQTTADASTNPMQQVSITADWSAGTSKDFSGYNQQILPAKVSASDGSVLSEGTDYSIVYTKDGVTTPTVFEVGTYTATITPCGIYEGSAVTQTVEIAPLDLTNTQYQPTILLEGDAFAYTASEIEPKGILRIFLGQEHDSEGHTWNRYSYLQEKTESTQNGYFTFSYANNVRPGNHTAIAIANGVSPNLKNVCQARFSITTYLVDIYFDPDGGEWREGDTTTTKISQYYNGVLVTPERLPKREGYNFVGWYDEAGNPAPDFTPQATETYFAGWEEIPEPSPEPTPPLEDGWQQDDIGWRYVVDGAYVTGWHWIDDAYGAHWYCFSETDTYMITSAWLWDGAWYWVCSSGPMIQGLWQWIDGSWYGFWWNGQMCTGWVWDADYVAWFYCYDNGVVARNTWVDGYYLNDTGICLL